MQKLLLVLPALGLLAACTVHTGVSDWSAADTPGGGTTKSSSITKSYEYTENGCPTGKHVFTGSDSSAVQQQYCDALENDKLNGGCAEDLRQIAFNANCPGSWSPNRSF
jgi:hypothetical protein